MRKLIIGIVVLAILGVGAYGSRKGYRIWRTGKDLAQAKEAVSTGDYAKALLWIRSALNRNGNNVEAVRLMGDFAELSQSPNAVYWRNLLVELQPDSVTNRILLGRISMVQRDLVSAKNALDGVRPADGNLPDILKLKGAFAVATGQFEQAESSFQAAATQEPKNPIPLLNLASIRVQRRDPQMASEARQILESLRSNPVVRTDALRSLALDALRQTNFVRAAMLAKDLSRETNASLNDRVLELDVLRAGKSPQLRPTLMTLQRDVATNAAGAFTLGRWMLNTTSPQEAFSWLQSLSPQLRTNLPVTMVLADTFLMTSNWPALQQWVGQQKWAEMEYLRLLFSTRALREQKLDNAAKAEWTKAMKAAEGRLDRLIALERLTTAWNWLPELEEVLWFVTNKYPSEKGAVQTLSTVLYAGGKTRSFLTLMAQQYRQAPKNLGIKNNLAAIALLLNAEQYKPHELAREVYEKQPDDPAFAATYAFSLYLQKKPREALQLMEKLKPEQLEDPGIAGYYGLILAASGEKAQIKKYLAIANKSPLLPEERQLFARISL